MLRIEEHSYNVAYIISEKGISKKALCWCRIPSMFGYEDTLIERVPDYVPELVLCHKALVSNEQTNSNASRLLGKKIKGPAVVYHHDVDVDETALISAIRQRTYV